MSDVNSNHEQQQPEQMMATDLHGSVEHSFRKAKWLSQSRVMQEKPQLLRNFFQRRYEGPGENDDELENGILPDNLLVERVIAQKTTVHGQLYLTKWRGLAYSEATWEPEKDLQHDQVSQTAQQPTVRGELYLTEGHRLAFSELTRESEKNLRDDLKGGSCSAVVLAHDL